MQQADTTGNGANTHQGNSKPAVEFYNRPPRIWNSPSQETVNVPAPPKKEALPDIPGFSSLLLPLLMMSMLLAISIVSSHGSLQQLAFLLPMAIFSLINPLSALLKAYQKRRSVRRRQAVDEQTYREALAELHTHLTQQADEQRRIALLTDPDLAELDERIRRRFRLWERRPEDPDFLSVRVGRGSQPFSVELKFPEVDVTNLLTKDLSQFKDDFTSVKNIPCAVSLPKVKSLGITGRRQDVAALAHALICQIATHHSPQDVRILGLYPISQRYDWEWMRDLPHTAPLKTGKGKQERLLAAGQEEADQLLNVLLEELSQRASKSAEASNNDTKGSLPAPLPHLVVIVHDYVEVRKHPALANAFKLGEQLGVSIIYLVAQEQAIPSECRGILRLLDENTTKPTLTYAAAGFAGEKLEGVSPDLIELPAVHRIASALSQLQAVEEGENVVNLPTNVRLLDLVELPYADQLDVARWWNTHPPFGTLRVPIGQGVNGTVWIDLNDAVHGPHGIIAGTTGAGKSELLQSLIAGLAITHHPHLVNFVLLDFKGGAAFKPFEKIPHTVGMVTDLSGRLTERALVALKSELKRREHILSEANAKNITQYQAMRQMQGQETSHPVSSCREPLPHLFIVIDEFAELAKEHPTFMEGLVSVVQKGRSLGVHLILATQKPTGSVNANIWSNLKFRICLRVASLQDSRDMLGRSEAALLPSTIPGRAYFQIGSEVFELFQSARTSLPARVMDESLLASKRAGGLGEEVTDLQVLMEALEPYQATVGADLFRPWPDPLPHRVSLPEIYKRSDMLLRANNENVPPYGWLTFPIGLVDLPAEQRQVPFILDMPRQGGHMLIAGAPGSGKSTFLRTIVTSLMLTHFPAQLNLYIVDFGGQSLRVFEKLPSIGGIFSEGDGEYIRRLLRKLQGVIEERKQLFMTAQVDDFVAYQRRRLANSSLPELPAVVLMIDKFTEFRQAHEKEMDLFLSLIRYGRSCGVYLIMTSDRPAAIPLQLMSLIELRIGLRLVESTDALLLLGKSDAIHLDPATPGRAYKRGKTLHEVHIALPVEGEDDDEQNQQLDELVSTLIQRVNEVNEAKMKNGQQIVNAAPPIRLLPDSISFEDFLLEAQNAASSAPSLDEIASHARSLRLPLGIEDLSLQPFALELNTDAPHALVGGGPGSGRTNVLHTSLLMLANTPAYASTRVVLVDFRRTSRSLRRLPNIWMYADTEDRLLEVVDALKEELRARIIQLRKDLERQQEENDEHDELVGADLAPILLIIDDYDQFSVLLKNPLNDLKEFMLQARDLHFHILVTGTPNDLARNDALLQQVRACRMGVILGSDPADQPLLGVRMSDLPPGRGYLVRRNQRYLIQVAHTEAKTIGRMAGKIIQLPQGTGHRTGRDAPAEFSARQVS